MKKTTKSGKQREIFGGKSFPGFVGEKLVEARQARGLRQTQLADKIDVSRQQVSKYEKGLQSPGKDTFDLICKSLSVPPSYLVHQRKRAVDTESAIYCRDISSKTKIQQLSAEAKFIWYQDIQAYVWRFIDLPENNLPDFNPPADPIRLDDYYIEEAADELRKHWHLGTGPINHLVKLVENNGIAIASFPLNGDKLDAFSQFSFDKPHIVFDSEKTATVRRRASIAHELGHLILHRNVPASCLDSKTTHNLMELQAHRFASAFLFPRNSFCEEVLTPNMNTFYALKSRWKVSIQVMIKRSYQLGFIDKNEEKSLNISIARRRWRKLEPLDDVLELEYPSLLKRAFSMLFEANVQSRSQAVDAIRLSRKDIEELANLESGFLNEKVIELKLKSRENLSDDCSRDTSDDFSTEAKVIEIGTQKRM